MLIRNEILNQIIHYLANNYIEISIKKDDKLNCLYLDLNTRAKSGFYVYLTDNENLIYFKARYGREKSVNLSYETFESTLNLFLYFARDCLAGRDYMDTDWLNLLAKHDFLTLKTETTTTLHLS